MIFHRDGIEFLKDYYKCDVATEDQMPAKHLLPLSTFCLPCNVDH